MVAVLETLVDFSSISKDITFLTEKARQALGRQICLQYAGEDKKLNVVIINSAVEAKIIESKVDTVEGYVAVLDREFLATFINTTSNLLIGLKDLNKTIVILTSEEARILVRKSIERELSGIAVISAKELTEDIGIEVLGEINFEFENE